MPEPVRQLTTLTPPPTPVELDGVFTARLRRGAGPALAGERASVLFDTGYSGRWTVTIAGGEVGLSRGAPAEPTTTVRTDAATLAAVIDGRVSGAAAFLDGRLTIRGNLALGLQLDGAFDTPHRPVDHPRAGVADPLGIRTGYVEAGPADAPPVLLLHGLGATNASLLPLLLDLARDHRVIAPDLPGFGTSAAPRWRYTQGQFGRWLAAFQRAVDAPRAVIIGNSLGGRIALEAAMSRPETVEALVLLCPSPAFRRLRQLVPAVRLIPPAIGRAPMVFHHRLVIESIRLMFSQPDRLPLSWYAAGADEFRRVMRSAAHRHAFFACLRQIYLEEAHGDRGFWTRLPRATAPALFLWGDRDRLVPAGFARHVVAALPHARSVILDDCGHVPQFELPEQTSELVRRFLDDRPQP